MEHQLSDAVDSHQKELAALQDVHSQKVAALKHKHKEDVAVYKEKIQQFELDALPEKMARLNEQLQRVSDHSLVFHRFRESLSKRA